MHSVTPILLHSTATTILLHPTATPILLHSPSSLHCHTHPPAFHCHTHPPASHCHTHPPSFHCHTHPPSSHCRTHPPFSHCYTHTSLVPFPQATQPKPHSRAMRALSAGAISRRMRARSGARSALTGRSLREPGRGTTLSLLFTSPSSLPQYSQIPFPRSSSDYSVSISLH